MITQKFQCTTQEPLILFKKAKTEQSTETLEYIPGSLFRGFVANQLFNSNQVDKHIDDLVFNGSVCFGDAHLVIRGQRSLPIPLSYHKFQSNVHGNDINLAVCDTPKNKNKQIKEGYFIVENGIITTQKIEISERMKSARSLAYRASEEGAMYLYRYLEAGQTFEFNVSAKTADLLETVREQLKNGKIYLGKSKSAEFGGKVKITALELLDAPVQTKKVKMLFAASNWCFLNEYGTYTSHLTSEMLCGKTGELIDWNKSFLRFRTYAPYNFHRKAFDAQRLIVEKGSVIVFQNEIEVDEQFYIDGIGLHKTEGFGEVLVNPDFLKLDTFEIKKALTPKTDEKIESKDPNFLILKERESAKRQLIAHFSKAEDLLKKTNFSGSINSSQWSNILTKVKQLNDITEIQKALIENIDTKVDKSKHSKWQREDLHKLKSLITECNNAQVFKIFVKNKINQKKDA